MPRNLGRLPSAQTRHLGSFLGSCARESGLCLFLLDSQSLTLLPSTPPLPGPTRTARLSMRPKDRGKLSAEHRQAPGDPEAKAAKTARSTLPLHLWREGERNKQGRAGEKGREQQRFPSGSAAYSLVALSLQTGKPSLGLSLDECEGTRGPGCLKYRSKTLDTSGGCGERDPISSGMVAIQSPISFIDACWGQFQPPLLQAQEGPQHPEGGEALSCPGLASSPPLILPEGGHMVECSESGPRARAAPAPGTVQAS